MFAVVDQQSHLVQLSWVGLLFFNIGQFRLHQQLQRLALAIMADFTGLTERLFKSIKVYQDYLHSASLPQPSHAVAPPDGIIDPAPTLPDDVAAAVEDAKEASHELHLLLLSPVELITNFIPNVRPL